MRFFSAWSDKARRTGPVYNTLDAMKLFAVFNMTVDHIGAYLFPELMWFRAIGRITFPVWFFLVGFSRGQSIGRDIWLYAILLMLAHPFVFQPIFPANALVTIIFCRLALNVCSRYGWIEKYLLEIIVFTILISPLALIFFEYGSVAFLYALMGRLVREPHKHKHYWYLVVLAYLSFIGWQLGGGVFDVTQSIYIALGTAWVVRWLAYTDIRPLVADWTAHAWLRPLTLLSRNTLSYYFYHRLLLQILAAWLVIQPQDQVLRWFNIH